MVGSPAGILRSLSTDDVIEEDVLEDSRDDDPLEGEDLVGGPGSYVIEDNDEVSGYLQRKTSTVL